MWPFISRQDVREEIELAQRSLITELRTDLQQLQSSTPVPQQPPTDTLLHSKIERLQREMETLKKIVEGISSVTPTGEPKDIHPRILMRTKALLEEINALEHEHAAWLQEQVADIQAAQLASGILRERLFSASNHILPTPEPITEGSLKSS